MLKTLFASVLFISSSMLIAEDAMNNDLVIKLCKAGLSDDLIVSTIKSSPGTYNTTADGIIALKSAGASDKVVAALVMKATAPASASSNPTPAAPAQAPAAPPASPAPRFHSEDGKVRVYVTDHPIFESNGIARAGGNRDGWGAAAAGHTQSGDDPRTVEVEADLMKVCPSYVIASNNPDRSDYVMIMRRRGGERSGFFAFGGLTGLALSAVAKIDSASLFQNDGDMVFATKQNTVEKAIKDLCAHVPAP